MQAAAELLPIQHGAAGGDGGFEAAAARAEADYAAAFLAWQHADAADAAAPDAPCPPCDVDADGAEFDAARFEMWQDDARRAEERRRAAWEVQIRKELSEATICITERDCPICMEALGDDSNGTVCQLSCGGGTHYFHAACVGRAWAAAHQDTAANRR